MKFSTGGGNRRRINAKVSENTRPTTSKVRQAIFNMLYSRVDLHGSYVLDLFAGTGAFGFEAAARGAALVLFVERDMSSVRSIAKNIEVFQSASSDSVSFTVARSDVLKFLLDEFGLVKIADVCFCDPPYAFDEWDHILRARPAKVLIAESNREIACTNGYEAATVKRYGGTTVTFMELHESQPICEQGDSD